MEKQKKNASSIVREIKRKTRRLFSAEEKIQIVLEELRGEDSIAAVSTASTKTTTSIGSKTSWRLARNA